MKAVRGGGSEEGGRVLWDATSRGLCELLFITAGHRVWPGGLSRAAFAGSCEWHATVPLVLHRTLPRTPRT